MRIMTQILNNKWIRLISIILISLVISRAYLDIKNYIIQYLETSKLTVLKDDVQLRNTASATTEKDNPKKKCKPVKDVIFVNTHQTGSNIITNIMQRFADQHNLKVALPTQRDSFHWPSPFKEEYVLGHKPGVKYDILTHQSRYDRDRMLNIMANKNTKIVTIIGNPVDVFEPLADDYKLTDKSGQYSTLTNGENFIKYIGDLYSNNNKTLTDLIDRNSVSYNIGRATSEGFHITKEKIVEEMNSFNLVMISDYMAESLAMLKEEFCWDLNDIVYFTMNKKPDKYRQKMKDREKLRENVKNWNIIDYEIFEHYNKTFWERVQKSGKKLKNDVQILKETNAWFKSMCLEDNSAGVSQSDRGFKLKSDLDTFKYRSLCQGMVRTDMDYISLLKVKQRQ